MHVKIPEIFRGNKGDPRSAVAAVIIVLKRMDDEFSYLDTAISKINLKISSSVFSF